MVGRVFATQPLRIQSGQPKIQPLVMELLTLKELLLKATSGHWSLSKNSKKWVEMTLLDPFRLCSHSPAAFNQAVSRKSHPRSWEVSIRNAVREIQPENKRRKAGDIPDSRAAWNPDGGIPECYRSGFQRLKRALQSRRIRAACEQSRILESCADFGFTFAVKPPQKSPFAWRCDRT